MVGDVRPLVLASQSCPVNLFDLVLAQLEIKSLKLLDQPVLLGRGRDNFSSASLESPSQEDVALRDVPCLGEFGDNGVDRSSSVSEEGGERSVGRRSDALLGLVGEERLESVEKVRVDLDLDEQGTTCASIKSGRSFRESLGRRTWLIAGTTVPTRATTSKSLIRKLLTPIDRALPSRWRAVNQKRDECGRAWCSRRSTNLQGRATRSRQKSRWESGSGTDLGGCLG